MVLGLTAGEWAAWVAAVGTVLAFGATTAAIWAGHRLRLVEHREAMYDEALKVKLDLVVEVLQYHQGTIDKATVNVENGGRRQITDLLLLAFTQTRSLGEAKRLDFLQAGFSHEFEYLPDKVENTGVSVRMLFTDVDGTRWLRRSDGRLTPYRSWPWWRRLWNRVRRVARASDAEGA